MRLNPSANFAQKQPAIKARLNYSHFLRVGILSSALAISACASNHPISNQANVQPTTNVGNPNQLTAEFVYQYLVAEVAGQRGDLATSGAVFYNLAKTSKEASLAERAAKIAAYGKVPGLTIPAVKLWAELAPGSNEAQQAMTEVYIATGNLNEAKPHLAELLAKDDTRAGGFLYLNNLLNKSPDKVATLKLVQSLAEPYPTLAEAQFAIAQAAYAAKKSDTAINALDKAEALKPGWDLAALVKGQILFEQSPQSAIAFYDDYLLKHPQVNEVRVNLTKMLITQKQFDAAKKQFPILLKQADDSKEKNAGQMSALVGVFSMQIEDYTAAQQYFEQSIKLGNKDSDQIYLYLAQIAEKQKNSKQAAEWYQKVQPDSAQYLQAQLGLATIIANTQSPDKAIALLDEIDNLTTEQQIIVIQAQANILAKAQRDQESFELLDKTIKNMPNTPELVYDYALAAERVKKLELMESELRKVISAKPDFAAAYNALGYSFADRNTRLTEAMQLIEKALSISPNDHYMIDSLGWVHYRKGNLDKAIDLLQQAYNFNQDPEIAAHLGEVLWKKGQHDEANKIWHEGLKADPKNKSLKETIKRFTKLPVEI
jgi:tetratricopeptide (TPR) repeat protein